MSKTVLMLFLFLQIGGCTTSSTKDVSTSEGTSKNRATASTVSLRKLDFNEFLKGSQPAFAIVGTKGEISAEVDSIREKGFTVCPGQTLFEISLNGIDDNSDGLIDNTHGWDSILSRPYTPMKPCDARTLAAPHKKLAFVYFYVISNDSDVSGIGEYLIKNYLSRCTSGVQAYFDFRNPALVERFQKDSTVCAEAFAGGVSRMAVRFTSPKAREVFEQSYKSYVPYVAVGANRGFLVLQ